MPRKKAQEADFEQALAELEEIVQKLENSELKLDDAIDTFSKGMKLAEFCNNRLTEAQEKIQRIVEKPDGELTLTLFDPEDE